MAEALSGVRIIELTSSPAAGLAGMILADFGAEVLRVAHPAGNVDDALPEASMYRRGTPKSSTSSLASSRFDGVSRSKQ